MKLNEIKKIFEADTHSDADEWLKDYTLENMDKWPRATVLKKLLKLYPFDGGVIYRGLNFADAEQWEKFKEETNNLTTLSTGSISSWSTDKRETYAFAITRPTYFLNSELMQAETQKNKNLDYMIGHIGVILKTRVSAGVGIDVRKSSFSKESEVILIPGTYSIEVDTTHIPFMRGITKENFKEHFLDIKSLANDDLNSKKFNHIMFHYKEFDDEMRTHLYTLIAKSLNDVKFSVEVEKIQEWNERTAYPQLSIKWNIPNTFFVYYAMLLPTDQASADKTIVNVLKQINTKFKMAIADAGISADEKFNFDISPSILMAIKIEKFEKYALFKKSIITLLGKRYNELNSYAAVNAINKMTDPKKQKDAIDTMAKNIIQTLSQAR